MDFIDFFSGVEKDLTTQVLYRFKLSAAAGGVADMFDACGRTTLWR
jgi:hypothetical protein